MRTDSSRTSADAVAERGDGSLVGGRAGLGDTVANPVTEVLRVTQAGDVGLAGASQGGRLTQHVGDAGFLPHESVPPSLGYDMR